MKVEGLTLYYCDLCQEEVVRLSNQARQDAGASAGIGIRHNKPGTAYRIPGNIPVHLSARDIEDRDVSSWLCEKCLNDLVIIGKKFQEHREFNQKLTCKPNHA